LSGTSDQAEPLEADPVGWGEATGVVAVDADDCGAVADGGAEPGAAFELLPPEVHAAVAARVRTAHHRADIRASDGEDAMRTPQVGNRTVRRCS
jgi:hypothetical protein